MRLRSIASTLATIFFAVVLLGASGDQARFTDLGHRMMCVCGCNQILLECNHVGCTYSDRMRQELTAAIQVGDNDDNILAAFVKEYGTTVIAAPGTHGFDRVAWIMPFAVFISGTVFAAIVIRNWKGGPRPPAAGGSGVSGGLGKYRDQARKETEL
ncbi:MAG: cytochrome c-type biogenesis protein CcmH [Acidobacteria bacterium]|nr:cytochrome c-type biogenesis protein CcmH [Acidobacteriota bacterium]MBV9146108.1 cytochrome c-type biogenesis protein CcmH [Acidobacteriota bacterium]MBV9437215.1 cytochrome c-type biogenesis protein CcmH [Acidobacteriota bacterium]